MPDRLLKYKLAVEVLASWEDAVRRFSPEEHGRWHRLLERLPDDILPEQLRDALAPIAVKSNKEQALFAQLFERALAILEAVNQQDEPLPPEELPPSIPGFWAKYGWWLLVVGLLLIGLLAAIFNRPEKQIAIVQRDFEVATGQLSLICPGIIPELDSFGSKISGLTIKYAPRGAILDKIERNGGVTGKGEGVNTPESPMDIGQSNFAHFSIQDDTCLAYSARDSVSGMDSLVLQITFSNEKLCNLQLRIFIGPPVGKDSTPKRPALQYHDPPFNHDQLIRNLEFKPTDTFTRWAPWLKAGFLLLLAGLFWWFITWRAQQRKKLVAQRDKSTKPPYVWNIRLQNLAPPDPGEAFGHTLQVLRRRTEDVTRLMDLPATVRATIRKGGMATFQFRQQTHPPEYLLLVDRQNAQDHLSRLYDDLYHVLRQNEVLAERFFFDGDIRLCFNEQYPEGLSLDELFFRFPVHRLLIIGTGRQLFSATTGRLAKWTEQFARWKDRALLSPLAAEDWDRRERALAKLFRFAPASISGLSHLIEVFETDEEQHTPQFDKLAVLAFGAPVLLEEGDLLQTLEKHYPDELTRSWLAACAIWPELHYDLTLWLGHWLGQESGQPVVTIARLGDLLRLPWFTTGEMPDPVRIVLLDWLRQAKPDLEPRLRTALHGLLEENAPPEGSAAWDNFAMRVAFNEWQLTNNPQRKKELEEKIAQWIDRNGDPDFIVICEMRGKPGPLDSLLPYSWKKHLFKGKLPRLGLQEIWKDVFRMALPIWIAAAIGLGVFWRPEVLICSGEQAIVPVGNDTLSICATSDNDKLLLWEYKLRAIVGRDDLVAFDSVYNRFLMRLDAAVRPPLYQECQLNIANAIYNKGVLYYKMADSLRQNERGFLIDSSVWKSRACFWFDKAISVDTSLIWIRNAKQWCLNENKRTSQNHPELLENSSIHPIEIIDAFGVDNWGNIPEDSRVVKYWSLSSPHLKDSVQNQLGSKTRSDSTHLKLLSRILYSGLYEQPLPNNILSSDECILLIDTKNIFPIATSPPVFNLLKTLKINNNLINITTEVATENNTKFILVALKKSFVKTGRNTLSLVNKSGSIQNMYFDSMDLKNGVYVLKNTN